MFQRTAPQEHILPAKEIVILVIVLDALLEHILPAKEILLLIIVVIAPQEHMLPLQEILLLIVVFHVPLDKSLRKEVVLVALAPQEHGILGPTRQCVLRAPTVLIALKVVPPYLVMLELILTARLLKINVQYVRVDRIRGTEQLNNTQAQHNVVPALLAPLASVLTYLI